ncbi:T9SS type A sorting domain-containing protein [Flavivirga algicola]|uniref:T9SS type A sorting domain-containing protein n=1 Tax=Flavivirga algicola TaxID=2729136 RepID=A0ABX1RUX1_9FLAO|nr:T9SS type A sorting domain-containing protein [Flavivirga algicola]NMH86810.1 T9SS type A sorting domain-containing protein [Flavivirga algicola]
MKINKKKYKLLFIVVFIGIIVNAQDLPPISTFYTPTIHTAAAAQITIGPSSGTGNDTNRIQAEINRLAVNRTTDSNGITRKGGVLTLNNGTYRIRGLVLRSNVHVRCKSGVVIEPFGPGDMIIANGTDIGNCTGCRTTQNFSFTGFSNNSRFTINIANRLNPGDGSRSFRIGNARNFKIGNINVIDDTTKFPTIEFLPGQAQGTVGPSNNRQQKAAAPTKGLIENITGTGYNPGWGVIQIQVGNNIYFRNIEGSGGATIRMESGLGEGLSTLNTENRTITKLDAIWGRFIRVKNGRCAVFASPHTHIQGFFDMRNITATNSEFAVFLAKGFRTIGSPNRPDESNFPIGTFQSNRSTVRNITTTFGNTAQTRKQELRYMPCAIRNRANTTPIPGAGNFFIAPSIAPIYNIANSGGSGSYNVKIIGLTANNYRNDVVDIITDPGANDFENCSFTPIENVLFVPNALKNTPNPLQNNSNKSVLKTKNQDLGNNELESIEIKIIPNPATNFIKITNAVGSNVSIYDTNGKLIKQLFSLKPSPIDISNLNAGLYFVKIHASSDVFKLCVKK